MRDPESRGFTLIEVMAALVVSGFVLAGAVVLIAQLTDASERIERDRALASSESNGARLLRRLLLDARVSTDSIDQFIGREREVEFSTVCDRPSGWLSPCRAHVAIDRRNDSSVVVADLSTGEHLELGRFAGAAALRYFTRGSGDSTWAAEWGPSIALPEACGVVTQYDTVAYLIGSGRE